MGAKTGIQWTDATWSPLRVRVREDAAAIATQKGYTSLIQIGEKMAGRVGQHLDFRKWTDNGLECGQCGWRGVESQAEELERNGEYDQDDLYFACPICREECAHIPLDERIDWIICGGESGPGARPFDIQWARNTIQQCKASGVSVFVKQLGAKPFYKSGHGLCYPDTADVDMKLNDRKGGEISEWPEDLRVREFPV